MSADTVIEQADSQIKQILSGLDDSPIKPYMEPRPPYPVALKGSPIEGKAVVAFTVSESGVVLLPQVEEATLPEFGEAALAAIKQWRFVPKTENGKPVLSATTMPFLFTPD